MTSAGRRRALWNRLRVAEAKGVSFPPDLAFQIRFWFSTLLYLLWDHTTRAGRGLSPYYFTLIFEKEESFPSYFLHEVL